MNKKTCPHRIDVARVSPVLLSFHCNNQIYICILAEVVEILYNASDNYVEYVKMDSFVVSLYIVPKIYFILSNTRLFNMHHVLHWLLTFGSGIVYLYLIKYSLHFKL